jgi:hypothetical protein
MITRKAKIVITLQALCRAEAKNVFPGAYITTLKGTGRVTRCYQVQENIVFDVDLDGDTTSAAHELSELITIYAPKI